MYGVNEVFRDHLAECTKHFGEWFNSRFPKKMPGRWEQMKPMVDFLGSSKSTVQRLLDGFGALPLGSNRVKLMCYLDLHGYKVIEFERMAKFRRNFAELVGFGAISTKNALILSEYSSSQELYRMIFGVIGVRKAKEELIYRIWKEGREELEQKKKYAYEHYRLKILFDVTTPVHSQQVILPVGQLSTTHHVVPSEKLAMLGILEHSLTLLESETFTNLSDKELASFQGPILRLSSRLSTLSSKILEKKVG